MIHMDKLRVIRIDRNGIKDKESFYKSFKEKTDNMYSKSLFDIFYSDLLALLEKTLTFNFKFILKGDKHNLTIVASNAAASRIGIDIWKWVSGYISD